MKKLISFVFLLIIITSCSTQKKVTNISSASQPTPFIKNDSIPIRVEPTLVSRDSIEVPVNLILSEQQGEQDTTILTEKKEDEITINISSEKLSSYGHIDMVRVLTSMEDYKLALQHMDSLQKYLAQQYEQMVQEFQRKETEYSTDTTSLPMVQQMRLQELQSLADRIRFFQETSQEQLEQEEGKLLAPIYDKMHEAAKRVAGDMHLLGVFEDRCLLYYSPTDAIDVTDKVILKLK